MGYTGGAWQRGNRVYGGGGTRRDGVRWGALLVVVCLVSGSLIALKPGLILGLVTLTFILRALLARPALIWVAVLASSLFFNHVVRATQLLAIGGSSIYLADALPVVLIAGMLLSGFRGYRGEDLGQAALLAGFAFFALLGLDIYRSLGVVAFSDALQARHLWPYVLVIALPFTAGIRRIDSASVARLIAAALIVLAVISTFRLLTGTNAQPSLGLQRIYQTWEPFLAAALGLCMLTYVIASPKVSSLHYLGLAGSLVPVAFSLFRTAWILMAVVAALVFILVRGQRARRGQLLGILGIGLALVLSAAIYSPHQSTYAKNLSTRFSELTTQLDSYRAREYVAVWREIQKNPLFGSGFGTNYQGDWTVYRSFSHNAYEWMWWRMGLVGLSVYVFFMLSICAVGVIGTRRAGGEDRALALGLVAALGFTLLAANLHENFENFQTNLVIALTLSQILVLAERSTLSSASR